MNCRPGDLAITVGAPRDNGLIVEVSEISIAHPTAGHCWVVTSLGSPFHYQPGELRHTVLWPDSLLRAIGSRAADQAAPTVLTETA